MKDNRKQYYEKHSCCPQCGNNKTSQTYMLIICPSDENPDYNKATCKCGWSGEVHQLVEAK
jgi:hypothetical protein